MEGDFWFSFFSILCGLYALNILFMIQCVVLCVVYSQAVVVKLKRRYLLSETGDIHMCS